MDINQQLNLLVSRSVDVFSADELFKKLERAGKNGRPLRIKYGADPSAPDIHLGHVVGLNKLREFQELGHTVVFIIGDFTGMIGDPSGRSSTRKPLTRVEVQKNAQSYKNQIFKILDPKKTEIRFNSEWCEKMQLDDFMRLCSEVTVAQILARDDFSKRYHANQPISLVEFIYPLIQAYDSVMVNADVEVGGTDQLFNLLLGRELQKSFDQEPQCVVTLPLIEGLDGTHKMSKSLNNYVGINESAREMYGKIMSIPDHLMWKYYSFILCLTNEEISELQRLVENEEKHPRDVKDQLAQSVVANFHSKEDAKQASEEFIRVFSQNELPDEIKEVFISKEEIGLLNLLVQSGLAKSNGEARRLVNQGAVRIDDHRINDDKLKIIPVEGMVIRSGKRGFAKIRLD